MKAIISGIKRMETHDGDGIRTTVFFKGCPLKCVWCHNPESISFSPQLAFFEHKCLKCGECVKVCPNGAISFTENNIKNDYSKCVKCYKCADICPVDARIVFGKEYSVEQLVAELIEDKAFFDFSGGGVTFSGGECLSQYEFVLETVKQLNKKGVKVNIDTCGYAKREILESIAPYVDVFLYDIKAIDNDLHKSLTGKSNEIILENIKYLTDNGYKVEVRFPLVQGVNDNQTKKIGTFLSQLKNVPTIKVLQYHKFSQSRYVALNMAITLPNVETTNQDVETAVNTLKEFNLRVINGITGN